VTGGFFGSTGQHNAFACNRTAGCTMDSLREDYDMKRDGRMDKAMTAGCENMGSFRALQNALQSAPARR
jgi:hypothetical protein